VTRDLTEDYYNKLLRLRNPKPNFKTNIMVLDNEKINKFDDIARKTLKGTYFADMKSRNKTKRPENITMTSNFKTRNMNFISPEQFKTTVSMTQRGAKLFSTIKSRNNNIIMSKNNTVNDMLRYSVQDTDNSEVTPYVKTERSCKNRIMTMTYNDISYSKVKKGKMYIDD
jgi:hypothetical protein